MTDLTTDEIASRLHGDGLDLAKANFEKATLSVSSHSNWNKYTFEILDAPTHFMLFKRLDFYLRRVGDKTIVFVFLHADLFEKEIALLLNSFSWSK